MLDSPIERIAAELLKKSAKIRQIGENLRPISQLSNCF